MKIRKGRFEFYMRDEVRSYNLNEFDSYRSSSCRFCTDLASENADISFGGIGSPDGCTTVIARSGMGYEIFNEAVDRGYIKARQLTQKEMQPVLNLARLKKVQMYSLIRRQNA
jgi:coenzyme F420 hydrogenase subunit beta